MPVHASPQVLLLRLSGALLIVLGGISIWFNRNDWDRATIMVGLILILIGIMAVRSRLISLVPLCLLAPYLLLAGGGFMINRVLQPPPPGAQVHVSVLGTWQGDIACLLVGTLFLAGIIQALRQRMHLRWW
jgi:hypothetical protein